MKTPEEIAVEICGNDGANFGVRAVAIAAIEADRAQRNEAGLNAARRVARWHLGYPSWADQIIDAYNDPDSANAEMDAEGAS